MPYHGETASKTKQATTLRDAAVAAALGRYRLTGAELVDPTSIDGLTTDLASLPVVRDPADVATVLSLDGSRQETPIGNFGNVRATVGFVRVAVASVDLAVQRDVSVAEFVNHQRLAKARAASVLSYALPGVGLSAVDDTGRLMGAAESWRHACNQMLEACHVSGVSLAEALVLVHTPAGEDPLETEIGVNVCPSCDAYATAPAHIGTVGRHGGACHACGEVLLLVDHLGVDDLLATYGRENTLNLMMDITERLTLVATIESLRRKGPDVLSSTAIVVDGPLSALRTSQRMVKPILGYLDTVSTELEQAGLGPLLLIGVEKTGQFVEHAAVISELIEPGHVMALPGDYIATHVTGRTAQRGVYGQANFYGRRFFYRRHDGHMLVVTVPARAGVAPWSKNAISEQWASYPALPTMLALLEELRSDQFPGAVQPLTWAHQESSLPLSASDALGRLAQDELGLEQNTRLRIAGTWS